MVGGKEAKGYRGGSWPVGLYHVNKNLFPISLSQA